ncbi:MAG TPA: DinB family protein [Burkholderiales bacterium]|nr:DinB family protein [Burkholderiales bacterium]
MSEVIAFLGLGEAGGPVLAPAALAARADVVLATAARLVRQFPDSALENVLPNRPRSWRVLAHHVFQIPVAFLEMEEKGTRLEYEVMTAAPPEDMRTGASIAAFGEAVRQRFAAWWARTAAADFTQPVETYFGGTSRHEMLERTVWHSAQHVRQLATLLESIGVAPDQPLGAAEIRGLPLTDKVWDEG